MTSKWPSYRKMVKIVNTRYPGLLDQVRKVAREERISGGINLKVFKLSPRFYVWLSWIWDKVRRRHLC